MDTTNFNKTETEKKIQNFWESHNIFEKTLQNRKGKKPFVFFEGPPGPNAPPHIGHFLTRAYKDVFARYKTMKGFFVLRKAGWDTHGLPIEVQVEKDLGFKNKKEIEEYGIAKFNRKAKELTVKYMDEWGKFTKRMGFWVDLKDAYITYSSKYMESLWWIMKKVYEKSLLYKDFKVVPYCSRCGTALSIHAMESGYKKIRETAVYVKFKIKGHDNIFVLVWTTTPWTLPGNLLLAVNPKITYVKLKSGNEFLILAKNMIGIIDAPYEVIDERIGEKINELIDVDQVFYEPIFKFVNYENKQKVYFISSEGNFIKDNEGTGIVHIAPEFGEDDFELSKKLKLDFTLLVDENGRYLGSPMVNSGILANKFVKDKEIDQIIIDDLREKGLLYKTEEIEHDYPFCWRCNTPIIYHAKNSWFIKITSVKEELMRNNEKINWIPGNMKEGRFGNWIKNIRDWALSRERYWGTPLPMWECNQCDNKTVVGSIKDLEKKALGSKNTYYILRHGLTERQEETQMIISSRLESDKYRLVPKGREDIENVAATLQKIGGVDEIYASPFIRTMETAEIIGKVLHKIVKKDERLGEFVHGLLCEDKEHAVCPKRTDTEKFDEREDSGESRNDVRARTADFMNEMETRHQNKKILIVGHGDPLWLLEAIANGRTQKEIIENKENPEYWYPKLAELKKINWRKIPKNELGELDLHRPFVDAVMLKCSDCGAKMKRAPDVIDVWFDSGAMPYAQWHYPFENKDIFKKQFPADFITEGIDQTRGWFYTLLAVSTLLGKESPYRNVIALGFVVDEKGEKMSKSKGNVVSPFDVMEKFGADLLRWYFYVSSAPGDPKQFSWRELETKQKGFFATLQNCIHFYELYAEKSNLDLSVLSSKFLLDKWIMSRFHRLIVDVSVTLDAYDATTAGRAIEYFVIEDLSNWWLRRSRKRKESLPLLRAILLEIAKLCAPFIPFTAEEMYMRLHANISAGTESVHLHDWPKADKKKINLKLEKEMEEIRDIVTAGLAQRKEKQIKVRQPLRAVKINRAKKLSSGLEDLIKDELNVKKIEYNAVQKEAALLDEELNSELVAEGYARELMRQIQDLRKEAKYKLTEKVFVQWHSEDKELSEAINHWAENIQTETLLREFANGPLDKKDYDIQKEVDLAPQKKIWLGIKGKSLD